MLCRSLTGAWIETKFRGTRSPTTGVAPLRGRGLKRVRVQRFCGFPRRSLTGAWIETKGIYDEYRVQLVAPLRGRGLKHQWVKA